MQYYTNSDMNTRYRIKECCENITRLNFKKNTIILQMNGFIKVKSVSISLDRHYCTACLHCI